MALLGSTPLVDAQDWLRQRVDKGDRCPCCTQFSKVYRWSLYSTAAQALILFYKIGGTTEYVHVNQLKDLGYKGQGDASRLRFWGLVEEEPATRPDGGRAGYWRVTQLGEQFIMNLTSIPKYVRVYDGRVLNFVPAPLITIKDALGTKFDYDHLMQGI